MVQGFGSVFHSVSVMVLTLVWPLILLKWIYPAIALNSIAIFVIMTAAARVTLWWQVQVGRMTQETVSCLLLMVFCKGSQVKFHCQYWIWNTIKLIINMLGLKKCIKDLPLC